MIIKVGTANPIKVDAVRIALADYDFTESQVQGVNIDSGVADQPQSTKETVAGALNRALGAFRDGADLGVGIESGLMFSPLGWMNFTAAVICERDDGLFPEGASPAGLYSLVDAEGNSLANQKGFHFGHSSAFPLPNAISNRMLSLGMELDEAVYDAGLVEVPNIGKVDGGFLGRLTNGRISRTQYSTVALQMALISYENRALFLEE